MAGRIWMKHKRSCVFALAVMILFSFLFWTEDEIPVGKLMDVSQEKAVLTDGLPESGCIQSVDEVCSAVFHATLMKRISHRGMLRSIRIYLSLIIMAVAAAVFCCVLCLMVRQFYYSRIVLIHYIHNSDGKK